MLLALVFTSLLDRLPSALAARATMTTIAQIAPEIAATRSSVATSDGWGTPLLIEIDSDGSRYRIVSAGADRVFDPPSWSRPMDLDPRSDIVFENGSFKRRFDVERWLRGAR